MLPLTATLALASCRGPRSAEPPAPSPARSAPAATAVDQALDRLEERLFVDQATVRFWREMKERHESVTAIATVSAERHTGRAAVVEGPREPRERPAKRSRVVARAVPSGQGGP